MSISFEGIFPGDRVHIEFAEPLAGWVEGVVHSARRNDVQLATVGAGEMDYLHLVREEVASVTVIQPPIKAGDAVWWEGRGMALIRWNSAETDLIVDVGSNVMFPSISEIPDDAVWLVRGGKLNPKLGGEG